LEFAREVSMLKRKFALGVTHNKTAKLNFSKVGLCGILRQCPPPEAMPKFLDLIL
jgi:hypothetical protein